MKEGSERYIFLDFLRFVAAGAVVCQHTFQQVFPAFGYFTSNYMNVGVLGVTLFFVVSGFIIPASFEKYNNLTKFWVSRVFRLFPLYLTIIFSTLVLIYLGIVKDPFPSFPAVIANTIMFAKFLGQPLIYRFFWTLNIEIIFYTIVSVIFVLGWLRKCLAIAYVAHSCEF